MLTPRFYHANRRRKEATAEAGAAVELSVCTAVEASLPIVNRVPLGDNSVRLRREGLSSCSAAAGPALRDDNEKAEASTQVAPVAAAVAAEAAVAVDSTAGERGTATREIAWREEEEV